MQSNLEKGHHHRYHHHYHHRDYHRDYHHGDHHHCVHIVGLNFHFSTETAKDMFVSDKLVSFIGDTFKITMFAVEQAKRIDYEKTIVKKEGVKDEYEEVTSVEEGYLEPEPVKKVDSTTVRIVFGGVLQKSPTTTNSSQGTRLNSRCANDVNIVARSGVKTIVKTEEVTVEHVEPKPRIPKFSKSRGVNAVNRVAWREQNKSVSFGDLSFDREDQKEEIIELSDLPWKCGECGKLFKRMSNMNMHIKLMHRGIKPKICQICSETFKTREQLSRHKLTHPELEVAFTCKYCSKPFGDVGLMNKHISKTHETKRFQCDQCQKTFTTASSVIKHKSGVHSSEKGHSCEYCGKLFTQKSSMVYHMKVHNGVKTNESFKCDVCDMDFLRAKLLNIHSITHRAEKNFKCGKCEYSGKTRQYLQKHEKSHTLRPQQYICSLCDLAYLLPIGLKKHEQIKHEMHNAEPKC